MSDYNERKRQREDVPTTFTLLSSYAQLDDDQCHRNEQSISRSRALVDVNQFCPFHARVVHNSERCLIADSECYASIVYVMDRRIEHRNRPMCDRLSIFGCACLMLSQEMKTVRLGRFGRWRWVL